MKIKKGSKLLHSHWAKILKEVGNEDWVMFVEPFNILYVGNAFALAMCCFENDIVFGETYWVGTLIGPF